MTKHTPGPWKRLNIGIDKPGTLIVPQESNVADGYIASCNYVRSIDETTSNARLIAAAPELLEACQAMIEWDDREKDHSNTFDERMAQCSRAFDLARAAISKATGETV